MLSNCVNKNIFTPYGVVKGMAYCGDPFDAEKGKKDTRGGLRYCDDQVDDIEIFPPGATPACVKVRHGNFRHFSYLFILYHRRYRQRQLTECLN